MPDEWLFPFLFYPLLLFGTCHLLLNLGLFCLQLNILNVWGVRLQPTCASKLSLLTTIPGLLVSLSQLTRLHVFKVCFIEIVCILLFFFIFIFLIFENRLLDFSGRITQVFLLTDVVKVVVIRAILLSDSWRLCCSLIRLSVKAVGWLDHRTRHLVNTLATSSPVTPFLESF